MRIILSALLSFGLGCGAFGLLPSTAYAVDFTEDTIRLHDILLKRSYTNSVRAGDALYLWDNIERARYVDHYHFTEGKLQFKQRISLPGMPLVYDSAAEEEVRPQFKLTPIGNKVMSHSTHRLNLLDHSGKLLADPLGSNTEYRELFGYNANSKNKAQFVGIGNDNILAWHPELKTISRWRLNADNKLELLLKNTLELKAFTRFTSNGQHHFLLESTDSGKTKVHRLILTDLQLGKNWEAPADVYANTHWVTGLSQLAYVDAEYSTSASIRRLNLGDTASTETIAATDFRSALGLDGQRLYFRNLSGQMCQLELVNGQSSSCQAIPAEITDLASVYRIDQQWLLLGRNAVFLQLATGELQKLQPSAINRGPSFSPGFAVVPQGVVVVDNWRLIDHEKNVTQLSPQQGPATACSNPVLPHERLDKVIRHTNMQSVIAHHQDCTAIHQITSSASGTEVMLNSHSFNHPGMKFLAYNGNESMLRDPQSVVYVKRNGDPTIRPLSAGGFTASEAIASATGWYFMSYAAPGRTNLHYLPASAVGQEPVKFPQHATPHLAVSDSHMYQLGSNANGQIQVASWRLHNSQFQHQTDVLLPEQYQPNLGNPVQLEIRNTTLIVWADTVAQPEHRSLLLFDLKDPDQPLFIGVWTNPLDNRERYSQASRIAVDIQGSNLVLQPHDSAEILQLNLTPVVNVVPRILENQFTVPEDSHENFNLTLQNALGMQLQILTKPTKGQASLSGTQLSYQPAENYHGDDNLVLTLSDPSGSYEFPISLQITPVNDQPVIAPIADLKVETGTMINGQAVATDVDGDKLNYRISETGSGTVSIGDTGKFSYEAKTPGADAFVIEVQDNKGAKASVKVLVTATASVIVTIPPTTVDNDKKSGGSLSWGFAALVLVWRLRKTMK